MSSDVLVDGEPVPVRAIDWERSSEGWTVLEFATSSDVRPGHRVEVDGWVGMVQKTVRNAYGETVVEALDWHTAVTRRRVNRTTGEYDPSFRFGDVIRPRGLEQYGAQYIVLDVKSPESIDLMQATPPYEVFLDQHLYTEWEIIG